MGLFSKNEAKKRYYYRHKKLGLCGYCPKKAVKNKSMCRKHLNASLIRQRKYREKNN